jgi:hypothetical protein
LIPLFAISALRFLRQDNDVSADIEEMETECADRELETAPTKDEEYTMKKLLTTQELRAPLMVAIMLQMIQQLSGINAVCTMHLVLRVPSISMLCTGILLFWWHL